MKWSDLNRWLKAGHLLGVERTKMRPRARDLMVDQVVIKAVYS